MRTGFVFGQGFWGLFLIALGVFAILRTTLHLNLSLFRAAAALFLILAGLGMLFGGGLETEPNTIIFDERSFEAENRSASYNVIFGQGRIDTRSLDPQSHLRLEVNSIFSRAVVPIDPQVPVRVTVDCVFAAAALPDGSIAPFGSRTYKSPAFREGGAFIDIDANVIFGSLEIVAR